MSVPISQRLFGIGGKHNPSQSVESMVERLREHNGEGDKRVIVAQLDDTVADANKLFKTFDLHHLPVVSGTKVVGVVSSTDLLTFFENSPLMDQSEAPLMSIMTADPQVIRKDASVRELVQTLAHSRFRCLPVVHPNGDIWDIVTTRDLVRFLELCWE
jgi:CBS domain-containing protein